MSHEEPRRWQRPCEEQASQVEQDLPPALAPGKRTRTMGLPQRPAGAPASVQQKPDPTADAARQARADQTARWLDTAARPDLFPPPVQMQSAGQGATPSCPSLNTPALQDLVTLEGPASPAQLRALQTLDASGLSGPWKALSWTTVQSQAASRIFHPERIDQEGLNACGPAAIMNITADTNPARFADLAVEVFTEGKCRGKPCSKELLEGTVPGNMAQVDWMLLSALRNSDPNGLARFTGKTSDEASGIAWPDEMKRWLEEIAGAREVETYSSYLWGTRSNTEKVNGLIKCHASHVMVLMLVRAGGLKNSSKNGSKKADGIAGTFPNHWVRLLDPVQFQDGRAILKVFTWGGNREYTIDEDIFEQMTYEYIVGATKDGIL